MVKNKNVILNLTSHVSVIITDVSVVCCLNVLAVQASVNELWHAHHVRTSTLCGTTKVRDMIRPDRTSQR